MMNCPYCKQELWSGYIHNSGQPVQWIPNGTKPSIWRGGLAKRSVPLSDYSFFRESKANAYYCPSCKVVIIPAE